MRYALCAIRKPENWLSKRLPEAGFPTMRDNDQSISNSDMGRLRTLIYAQSGINLSAEKKTMLELRLRPRLRVLAIDSYRDYCEYLFSAAGQREEIVPLLDAVSTNKTDFFREPDHFEYLKAKVLPEMIQGNGGVRPLLFWSAGCSSGEEPYTLAMVLSEYERSHPGLRFRVLATDLCTTVLEKATLAVFNAEVVAPIPSELRRRYFLRGRDRASKQVRIVPELRDLVEFRRLNFMDSDYGLREKMDVIFCRNVIIYFDRVTQEQILQKLTRQLAPGGTIFLGHSETLSGLDVPLVSVGPSTYRKPHGRA
jgi:chemotaxis protein methyltransferase CheR